MTAKEELITKCFKCTIVDDDNTMYDVFDINKFYDLVLSTFIENLRNILNQNKNLTEHYINYICDESSRL